MTSVWCLKNNETIASSGLKYGHWLPIVLSAKLTENSFHTDSRRHYKLSMYCMSAFGIHIKDKLWQCIYIYCGTWYISSDQKINVLVW